MAKYAGSIIMEFIWIVLSIVLIAMALWKSATVSVKESYMLYIMFVVSVLMFLHRRRLRLKDNSKSK